MRHDKSETENRVRSQVADVEETEIDYVVRTAGVPREQARQALKRLRKQSPNAQEPMTDSLSPMRKRDEDDDLETKIRTRAYQMWEDAGRPHGRDLEHWFAAESEVAGRPAATMSRQGSRETLPNIGSAARDQNELPRNNRYKEPEAAETNHDAEFDPSTYDSSSARKLQRSVNTPPGLPLSRPLSDS